MPLPDRLTVKLSSEAAEFVSLTPVVVQDIAFSELMEQILGIAGPAPARVRDILRRGSLVSGGSRYRWEPCDAQVDELESLIRRLPGPEPHRAFEASKCLRAILIGKGVRIEVQREAASQHKLLRRANFWDVLLAEAQGLEYSGYLYRERADRFACPLSREASERIRSGAELLKYERLARQVAAGRWERAEWVAARSG